MSNKPPVAFITGKPIDNTEKGLVLSHDALTQDHGISRQFRVNDVKGVGFFKFVNEAAGGGVKVRTATITAGPGNTGGLLGTYSGKDTVTDQMFGQYISKNHPESAASKLYLHLDPSVPYYLNYWNDDLSAGPVVLGHNNNNNL